MRILWFKVEGFRVHGLGISGLGLVWGARFGGCLKTACFKGCGS